MVNPKTKHNVPQLFEPEDFSNCPITRMLRQSARHLLKPALELEVQQFTHHYEQLLTENGLQRIVRNELVAKLKAEAKAREFVDDELSDTIAHLLQKLAIYEQEDADDSKLN